MPLLIFGSTVFETIYPDNTASLYSFGLLYTNVSCVSVTFIHESPKFGEQTGYALPNQKGSCEHISMAWLYNIANTVSGN